MRKSVSYAFPKHQTFPALLSVAIIKFHFQQIVKVIVWSLVSMSEVFMLQDTNFMNNSMQNLYKNVQQAPSANGSGECFCTFLLRVKDLVSAGPINI